MMMVQMFGLATTDPGAVYVAIGRHGEMHFFHGRSFRLGGFAVTIREFYVFKQGLQPSQGSRGGRHFHGGNPVYIYIYMYMQRTNRTQHYTLSTDRLVVHNNSRTLRIYGHMRARARVHKTLSSACTGCYANTIEGLTLSERRPRIVCNRGDGGPTKRPYRARYSSAAPGGFCARARTLTTCKTRRLV